MFGLTRISDSIGVMFVVLFLVGCSASASEARRVPVSVPETRSTSVTEQRVVSETCDGNNFDAIDIKIDPARVIRQSVPAGLFGFTMDWLQFQIGHVRNGRVRPVTVAWLKPFPGALYRYSGGNAFEWRNAVGPISERKEIFANYHGMALPEFGPSEFVDFLQRVSGRAVILLNIVGPRNDKSEQSAMIKDNLDYISWLATNGTRCVTGTQCQLAEFELGNEVDWDPFKWSARDYADRVLPLITAAKSAYPGIKFAAMGQTAPWGGSSAEEGNPFDTMVAEQLAQEVESVTIHPYYDGLSIPEIQPYIQDVVKKYRVYNSKVRVLVTEHGRWPAMPETGDWSVNWYQASGSGGALSTADFTLMQINDESVSGASWHSIAVAGPWQLFHLDQAKDSIYPSAVYWSLRTLRAGFLADSVEVTPSLVSGGDYWGGYEVRSVAMKNNEGSVSLMGVNRGSRSKAISVKIAGVQFSSVDGQFNVFQGDEASSDNTDEQPNRFRMNTLVTTSRSLDALSFCVPPKSTYSIVVKPAGQSAAVGIASGQQSGN